MSSIIAAIVVFQALAFFVVSLAFAADTVRRMWSRSWARAVLISDSARFEDQLLTTVAVPEVHPAVPMAESAKAA